MAEITVKDAGRNVQKIVIQAFKDKKLADNKQSPIKTFTIPINPENLSQKLAVKIEQNQGPGSKGSAGRYAMTLPEELKLDFHLDNTNTVAGNTLEGVAITEQVRSLLDTVYALEGDTHRPNFLKIVWNKAEIFGVNKPAFDCQLQSLDIQYVLFKPTGEPLRAKISASFVSYIEAQKRLTEEGKNSPDLTHVRTMTPADRLWLMTNNIYESPAPLLQVARANGLTTFRRVESGSQVTFPPYDRNEA